MRTPDYEAIGHYVYAVKEMEKAISGRDTFLELLTMRTAKRRIGLAVLSEVEEATTYIASLHGEVVKWAEEANVYAERAGRPPIQIWRSIVNQAAPVPTVDPGAAPSESGKSST